MRAYRLTPGISIHKLTQVLIRDQVFHEATTPQDTVMQRQFLFSVIGWLTGLYIPSSVPEATIFRIEDCGAKYPKRTSVDIGKAQRPMDELLFAFGEMLPRREMTAAEGDVKYVTESSFLKFHVSFLNAATLKLLAKINLVWVDTISAHLDFDPTIPALFLFRSPAICALQATQNSILSV